jgi:periplasmic divalent cation tolerance protein
MAADHIVVLITVPTLEKGKSIAEALLKKRLAACVNILPNVHSLYIWENEICDEQEVLLVCKSRSSQFEEHFIPTVKALHPYEVPEIIALPLVKGLQAYLNWIDEVTSQPWG